MCQDQDAKEPTTPHVCLRTILTLEPNLFPRQFVCVFNFECPSQGSFEGFAGFLDQWIIRWVSQLGKSQQLAPLLV